MSRSTSKQEDSIIIDYFKYTKIYQSKYGENTIIFMQVGAFFEVYSLKNPYNNQYEITKITDFTEYCNLNIAEKKISIGNGEDRPFIEFPLIEEHTQEVTVTRLITHWLRDLPECKVVMAGVRDYHIDKYIQKMTDAGFTVVVFTQEKDGRNIVKRKLQSIYSPGTYIGFDEDAGSLGSNRPIQRLTNHIISIWMERIRSTVDTNQEKLVCGISCLNIFTGETYLFEYEIPYFLNPTTFDELERYISTFYPKELIIISNLNQEDVGTILKYIGISSTVSVHTIFLGNLLNTKQKELITNCTKQNYIQQILSTFYGNLDVYNNCLEFQSNMMATQSFGYLLHFIQEHNPDLVKKIHMPIFSNMSNRTILANHTLKQLNIINDDSNDGKSAGHLSSVCSFLNKCSTSMGKRHFYYQLTHPVFDVSWLECQYNTIDAVIANYPIESILEIRRHMKCGIRDLAKISRQIVMGRIYPSGIVHLYESVKCFQFLYERFIGSCSNLIEYLGVENGTLPDSVTGFLEFIESRFVLEHCVSLHSMTSFENNIICRGVSKELDDCIGRRSTIESLIQEIKEKLTNAILSADSASIGNVSNKEDYIKIHETEKSGISFQLTKKRSKILKGIIDANKNNDVKIIEIHDHGVDFVLSWRDICIQHASSNYDEISFPYLTKQTKDLHHVEDQLNLLIASVYRETLSHIESNWYDFIDSISGIIANLDVILCKSYLAVEYRYCRPGLCDSMGGKAYVDAKDLRHCLIEHLQQSEIYVTNDVWLGCREQDGILLYGTNAVGKTSIIRAIGIAVIMAQAGCYVPCSSFTYWPYRSIYSRILGNDNIFKGLSTFAVEMSELRMILKMADRDSLILGDELCSGTETDSALAIFMAGLIQLAERESSFIFATHFHEIAKFEEMQKLVRVVMKHMSVVYDYEQECLVYDRKVRDGPGNKMYGLEVCKSLFLPNDFLELAYQIRNRYCSTIHSDLESPESKYNSLKIRGVCEMCGERMGEEIHHLQWQRDADAQGYIGHFHKNHPANLISVCESCHHKFHEDSVSLLTNSADNETTTTTKTKRHVRKKTTNGYCIQSVEF